MIERLKSIGPQTNITIGSAISIIGTLCFGYMWIDSRFDRLDCQNASIQRDAASLRDEVWYTADMRRLVDPFNKQHPELAFIAIDDVIEKRFTTPRR